MSSHIDDTTTVRRLNAVASLIGFAAYVALLVWVMRNDGYDQQGALALLCVAILFAGGIVLVGAAFVRMARR
jgi:uncharacterized membrane protein